MSRHSSQKHGVTAGSAGADAAADAMARASGGAWDGAGVYGLQWARCDYRGGHHEEAVGTSRRFGGVPIAGVSSRRGAHAIRVKSDR